MSQKPLYEKILVYYEKILVQTGLFTSRSFFGHNYLKEGSKIKTDITVTSRTFRAGRFGVHNLTGHTRSHIGLGYVRLG